jgi:hypothetical protein
MSLSDLQLIPNALQIKESLLRISIVFGEHGDGIHSIFNSISTEVVLGGFIVHISTGAGRDEKEEEGGRQTYLANQASGSNSFAHRLQSSHHNFLKYEHALLRNRDWLVCGQ